MSLPFFVFTIGKGEAVVLRQQGGCVDLGEVRQCISLHVLSIGENQRPSEQDLNLSAAYRRVPVVAQPLPDNGARKLVGGP